MGRTRGHRVITRGSMSNTLEKTETEKSSIEHYIDFLRWEIKEREKFWQGRGDFQMERRLSKELLHALDLLEEKEKQLRVALTNWNECLDIIAKQKRELKEKKLPSALGDDCPKCGETYTVPETMGVKHFCREHTMSEAEERKVESECSEKTDVAHSDNRPGGGKED